MTDEKLYFVMDDTHYDLDLKDAPYISPEVEAEIIKKANASMDECLESIKKPAQKKAVA